MLLLRLWRLCETVIPDALRSLGFLRWSYHAGVKLSCNKGLCASGCFFVVTTSFSLAGLYSLTFGAFGFGGLLWVALVFAPATVSPPVLRRTRTAYCAADVVKRQWSTKKNKAEPKGSLRNLLLLHLQLQGFFFLREITADGCKASQLRIDLAVLSPKPSLGDPSGQ